MRDFLNGILAFIVAESLTDDEFATVTSEIPIYTQSTYDDLVRVLRSRSGVSTYVDRLSGFYTAKGVVYSPITQGNTNIFLGATLCR